jgi:hypothetical protein
MAGPAWRQYQRRKVRACWGARRRPAGEIARRMADFHARVRGLAPGLDGFLVNGTGARLSGEPEGDAFAILRGMRRSGMICRNASGHPARFGSGALCASGFDLQLSPAAQDEDAEHFAISLKDGAHDARGVARNGVAVELPYHHDERGVSTLARDLIEAAVIAWSPSMAMFGSDLVAETVGNPRDDYPVGFHVWLPRALEDPDALGVARAEPLGGGVLLSLNAPERRTFTEITIRMRCAHAKLAAAGCLSMQAGA